MDRACWPDIRVLYICKYVFVDIPRAVTPVSICVQELVGDFIRLRICSVAIMRWHNILARFALVASTLVASVQADVTQRQTLDIPECMVRVLNIYLFNLANPTTATM